METPMTYGHVAISNAALQPANLWVAPTSEEVRSALSSAGLSGEAFSRMVAVDGRTVRRWTLGEKTIPYAAWCLLCLEAGYGAIWK